MTDFGIKDGNVGVMKGVIWSICPSAQISDLSHMIGAQNVREAAMVLARSAPYFPENSVHVVVVDPGVGTARRPMAARFGSQFYVGPDNGTITLLLEFAEKVNWSCEFVHLDKHEYWLSEISHVFHGRDIFSPVAAHLASGFPMQKLGTMITDPIKLELPKPKKTENGWIGEIMHIDHFGNLSSNIRVDELGDSLQQPENIRVQLGGIKINGLVNTFGDRAVGELIALMGSTGNLVISVVNGSAAAKTKIAIGNPIEVKMDKN